MFTAIVSDYVCFVYWASVKHHSNHFWCGGSYEFEKLYHICSLHRLRAYQLCYPSSLWGHGTYDSNSWLSDLQASWIDVCTLWCPRLLDANSLIEHRFVNAHHFNFASPGPVHVCFELREHLLVFEMVLVVVRTTPASPNLYLLELYGVHLVDLFERKDWNFPDCLWWVALIYQRSSLLQA